MKIKITEFNQVYFDTNYNRMNGCTNEQFLKYLKGIYTNKDRFINRYLKPLINSIEPLKDIDVSEYKKVMEFITYLEYNYNSIEGFTFKDAFELNTIREFQALVFSSIDITSMISKLGNKRIKADGIDVIERKYSKEGEFLGTEKNTNVYETYEIKGDELGLKNEKIYAVKCWDTTTNKEHWIWIDEKYKDDPLSAIASTFHIHENLIPHIKCLKRQGDILLVEMDEDIQPEGNMIPLTKEQYFGWLTAQA